jgi:hypothetical protein
MEINDEVFGPGIMHWGEVNYRQEDALLALNAAFSAFAVLKMMDKEK